MSLFVKEITLFGVLCVSFTFKCTRKHPNWYRYKVPRTVFVVSEYVGKTSNFLVANFTSFPEIQGFYESFDKG